MDAFFLAILLIVMATIILGCLIAVFSLWGIQIDPDPRGSKDPWGLRRMVASIRKATFRKGTSMDLDEAVQLSIRTRTGLSAGILGFSSLILICATIIVCVYLGTAKPNADLPNERFRKQKIVVLTSIKGQTNSNEIKFQSDELNDINQHLATGWRLTSTTLLAKQSDSLMNNLEMKEANHANSTERTWLLILEKP